MNKLLERLKAAFDAERSFAANAAHELRTPLAGAIAQAQRLQAETHDASARQRAADIEASLKRLTRMAERLLQLARAEGGPMRLDRSMDLRKIAEIILADLERVTGPGRIVDAPAASSQYSRTLIPMHLASSAGTWSRMPCATARQQNRSTSPSKKMERSAWRMMVPSIEADVLAHLTERFQRDGGGKEGTGLGLAIVAAIADRISSRLILQSPRPKSLSGFEASIRLPLITQAQQRF